MLDMTAMRTNGRSHFAAAARELRPRSNREAGCAAERLVSSGGTRSSFGGAAGGRVAQRLGLKSIHAFQWQ